MALNITKDSMTEDFKDYKNLIYKVLHGIMQKYNLPYENFEEYESRAFFHFVRAKQMYIPKIKDWKNQRSIARQKELNRKKKIAFSSYLQRVVYLGLRDDCVKDWKAHKYRDQDVDRIETYVSNLGEIMADLTDDSRTVVSLILETPDDLMELIERAGGRTKSIKRVLTSYLQKQNWTRSRTLNAFRHIETVVCS